MEKMNQGMMMSTEREMRAIWDDNNHICVLDQQKGKKKEKHGLDAQQFVWATHLHVHAAG